TLHNDTPPPAVSLSSSHYVVAEGAGSVVVTATLSAASGMTATVIYSTADGSALAGSDYVGAGGTLTFTPGLTQTTFSVAVISDTLPELDEDFTILLSGPISASLGSPFTASVTISDDDPAPLVNFSSAAFSVNESAGSAIISVTLSAASGLTATVQ